MLKAYHRQRQKASYRRIYRPLRTADRPEIRLLTLLAGHAASDIHCTLRQVFLDEAPEYSALSYAWGDPSITRKIFVDGRAFQVTANLYDALGNFRGLYPGLRLWVDAICINQANLLERGEQVQLMRKVYSQATETCVWLGVEADESDKAFDLFDVFSECWDSSWYMGETIFNPGSWGPPSSWKIPDELFALELLLARSWWYRVWVVQEVAVSKNPWVYCGTRRCRWEMVGDAANFLKWHVEELHDITSTRHCEEYLESFDVYYIREGLLQVTPTPRTEALDPDHRWGGLSRINAINIAYCALSTDTPTENLRSPKQSLLSLLAAHRTTEATDPRDKCIAIAGLAYEEVFPPSLQTYTVSINHIYTLATKAMVADDFGGPLDFLEFSGLPRKRSDLPSWVPDWSYDDRGPIQLLSRQLTIPDFPGLVPYTAAANFDVATGSNICFREENTLSVRGFIVDLVDGISFCDRQVSLVHTSKEDSMIMQPEDTLSISSDEDFNHVVEALWRTLVANRNEHQEFPPEPWARLVYATIYHCSKADEYHSSGELSRSGALLQWYNHNKHFIIFGSSLEEIVNMRGSSKSNLSDLSSTEIQMIGEIQTRMLDVLSFRRLSITRKGHLSLAPAATRRGDTVAILSGCQLPLVLRNHGDHFEFVGCCYVYGIMEGQAMVGLHKGEYTPQVFDIR